MLSMFNGKVMGMDKEEKIEKNNNYGNLFKHSSIKKDLFGDESKNKMNEFLGFKHNNLVKQDNNYFNKTNKSNVDKFVTFKTKENNLWNKTKQVHNIDKFFILKKQKENKDANESINKINSFLNVKRKTSKNEIDINNIIGVNRKNNFDIMGFNRIKQQRGLSLFGNADGDKVPNILDCEPFNKKKHGAGANVDSKDSIYENNRWSYTTDDNKNFDPNTSYEEYYSNPMEELDEELSKQKETVQPTVETIEPEIASNFTYETNVQEPQATQTATKPSVLTTFRKIVGIPSLNEVIKQRKKLREIRLKAFTEGAAKVSQLSGEDLYRQTYMQTLNNRFPGVSALKKRYILGPNGEIIPFTGVGIQRKRPLFDDTFTGLGVASNAFNVTRTEPWKRKRVITDLYGMGRRTSMNTLQPTQPVQPVYAQPTSQERYAPPNKEGLVWSPYSKRYVRYPRGPYKRY